MNAVAPGPLMAERFHPGKPAAAEQAILERQPWPWKGPGARGPENVVCVAYAAHALPPLSRAPPLPAGSLAS